MIIRNTCVLFLLLITAFVSAAELEPLPRVKISGAIDMSVPDSDLRAQSAPPPPVFRFETWLLGDSFVTRISGERLYNERIKEGREIGGIHFEDGSEYKLHRVPFNFVIAHQPAGSDGATDFPVRYFEAPLDKGFSPRVENMSLVSPREGWFGWLLLQRATLAAQGLPNGTTYSVTMDARGTRADYYLPPEIYPGGYRGEQHYRCVRSSDSLVVQSLYRGRAADGREEPEMLIQQMTYSDFDQRYPALPLRSVLDWNMLRVATSETLTEFPGQPAFSSTIREIEPIPQDWSFDDVVAVAAMDLPRIFNQNPNYAADPLTSSTLRDFKGNAISTGKLADKVVLMHFWASWAPDNEKRFLEIQRIVAEHSGDPLFGVVSINFDAKKADAEKVLDRIRPDWPQAYVGADVEVAQMFPFRGLPSAIIKQPTRETFYDSPGGPSKPSALFGGYGDSSPVDTIPTARVRHEIKLERRRIEAGGVFAEFIGEEARELLKNATSAEAYLLMGREPTFESDAEPIEVPENAKSLGRHAVLYRWPNLSEAATEEVSRLLLRNDSYRTVHPRDEHHVGPSQEEPLYGLCIRDGDSKLVSTIQFPWLEFRVNEYGDENFHFSPRLYLTETTEKKLLSILNKHLPSDAKMKAGVKKTMAEWSGN